MWPLARASRQGLLEFAFGGVFITVGVLLLKQAGILYLDTSTSLPRFFVALALLTLSGIAVFRIARRREYPWLLALAAIAIPLFDPTKAPYSGHFRLIVAARDLVLIAAAVLFVAQSTRRADELERRIHLEALAWSYTAVILALLIQTMAADVLPPIRATWVASGLLAGWVISWLVISIRYQG